MDYLKDLENQSIFIIREAYAKHRNMALLWSIGKDSTTLLWLCRKAFFGKIPFPVLHLDTSFKFPEIYDFRDKYTKEWGLDLIVEKNNEALKCGTNPWGNPKSASGSGKLDCCSKLKTDALKMAIKKHGFEALLVGIRRDEHGIRAKERVFSSRDKDFVWDYKNQSPELWNLYQSRAENDDHLRIHPLLHWREIDIWEYIKKENIPTVGLYFARLEKPFDKTQGKKRYRSIGCEPCCAPIESNASNVDEVIEELKNTKTAERAGRAQDKENEYTMQKLRSLGYM